MVEAVMNAEAAVQVVMEEVVEVVIETLTNAEVVVVQAAVRAAEATLLRAAGDSLETRRWR